MKNFKNKKTFKMFLRGCYAKILMLEVEHWGQGFPTKRKDIWRKIHKKGKNLLNIDFCLLNIIVSFMYSVTATEWLNRQHSMIKLIFCQKDDTLPCIFGDIRGQSQSIL